jgi:hypothetical protein
LAPVDRAAVGGPRGNPAENEEQPQAPAPLVSVSHLFFNQVNWVVVPCGTPSAMIPFCN